MTNSQIDFTNTSDTSLTVPEVFLLVTTKQWTLEQFNVWCQLQYEYAYNNGGRDTNLYFRAYS